MSTFSLVGAKPVQFDARVLLGLAFAAMIAWFQPFDLAFAALTLGSPALRATGIIVMALVGFQLGPRTGLEWAPAGQRHAIAFPIAVAAAVALWCAGLDWLFRPVLHSRYLQVVTEAPLAIRIAGFMLRAVNENIIYRLFAGSVLAWGLGLVWKGEGGRPSKGTFFCAFAVAQAANTWINVTSQATLGGLVILHDTLRYFAPGMVWSWIYWKRGFQANEIASTSVHLFFQPLVSVLLIVR